LHYRLELWRTRSTWFDEHLTDANWDVVAHYDPLPDDYVLIRSSGTVGRHASVDALAKALELPYRVALAPKSAGKFYYLVRLEVSTLNDTDLQEVERWLKGDVSPTVTGRTELGSTLARSAQRLLVRMAGLPRLSLEARSKPFELKP